MYIAYGSCSRLFRFCVLFSVIIIFFSAIWMLLANRIYIYNPAFLTTEVDVLKKVPIEEDKIDFSSSSNITGYNGSDIVPNIVHMIHMGNEGDVVDLIFIQVVCLRAAYFNQKPDKIIIHCNCRSVEGKYWDMVKNIPTLSLQYVKKPKQIFGKKFKWIQHASDIVRMQILMKYGGIYIDSDSYIVQPLNKYFKYEMTLGWKLGKNLGTMALIAHKDARFLRLWYDSYRNYQPDKWYFNAGQYPTSSILEVKPYLVHSVPEKLGNNINLAHMLYQLHNDIWKTFDVIHLLHRHRKYLAKSDKTLKIDENTIKQYNKTFGDMARLVLYGTSDMINDNRDVMDISVHE